MPLLPPATRLLRPMGWWPLALSVFLFSLPASAAGAPPTDAVTQRPSLFVLLVFDQLRADYLERWQSLFVEGGFHRLQTEGLWFRNCNYPYSLTVTGAGHASLLTGCMPAVHGVVANEWYDRVAGKVIYCVSSNRATQVPPAAVPPGTPAPPSASPERLLVPSFGEVLKQATQDRARIVALSLKDRASVLPGGHRADLCVWFDTTTGQWATSTYYPRGLPTWLVELNQQHPADPWFSHTWTRLLPSLDYARWSGPDDVLAEGVGVAQGRVFPHPQTGGLANPGKQSYEALYNSPFGNYLLAQLAQRAIVAEQLGRHDVPDLLTISFSANDAVGHCWGPDSQEVLDVTLRSDRIVRDLLQLLDEQVGAGRYLLALTADHGVAPIPEVRQAQGLDGRRMDADALRRGAESFLADHFKPAKPPASWFEATVYPWLYLNRRWLEQAKLPVDTVARALADWLSRQSDILNAYTRAQLEHTKPSPDPWIASVRRSYHPERCGDVYVLQKPYCLISSLFDRSRASHGTPFPYDTHVPLLVYGWHTPARTSDEPITPLAIASLFARACGIAPPAAADRSLPLSLDASASPP